MLLSRSPVAADARPASASINDDMSYRIYGIELATSPNATFFGRQFLVASRTVGHAPFKRRLLWRVH